jgi:hypothetical protein
MSALDRLRAIEISREAAHPEPSKPTKAPFDGFVGTPPPSIPKYSSNEGGDGFAANAEFRDTYAPAREHDEPRHVDPDVERRRNRALAILADEPGRQIAVVAEPGNPARVTVVIRGVAVGELTIPAQRYDGFALLALMQQYWHA